MSRLFCICFFGTKIYPIFARMNKNENIMNKVLIIDDEPQIRQLLARILGLEGYEVLQAGDCKAAVKQMEYSPNVVLCDVFLPDGNGVDFIKTIKKIGNHFINSPRKYTRRGTSHKKRSLRLHNQR